MFNRKIFLGLLVIGLIATGVLPNSAVADPRIFFTINDDIDFTGLCVGEPIDGTVEAGSDLCEGGTFVDETVAISKGTLSPTNPAAIGIHAVVKRIYTCPGGKIEVWFNPLTFDPEPPTTCEDQPVIVTHNHFVIKSGTGAYEGIHGRGDWDSIANGCFIPCVLETGADTLTGWYRLPE